MEQLEPRLAMYATVAPWGDPHVTYSFAPDGTIVNGVESSMFAKLDPVGAEALKAHGDENGDRSVDILDVAAVSAAWGEPGMDIFAVANISNHWNRTATGVWQDEIRDALNAWDEASGLSFTEVADDGSPIGAFGPSGQGDPRFGDIRFSMAEAGANYVAYGYYPSPWDTIGGDIIFDDDYRWKLDGRADLFDVSLHEIGHAVGLGHAGSDSVMWPTIRDYAGLFEDDVFGVQSLYGVN